jgi:hypothetical protein
MEYEMQEEFLKWLSEEGKKRGLHNDRRLCLAAGLSPSVISKARLDTQPIGWEACLKFAEALQVPESVVLVKAGHIPPPKPDWDSLTEELVDIFQRLSKKDKEELMFLARYKAG